jgi:hypothetical protein
MDSVTSWWQRLKNGQKSIKESKLLDSIGSAEMEQQIEKRVMVSTKAAKDSMIEKWNRVLSY